MIVFIVIQALQALLSVSLGPLSNLIAVSYGVSVSRVNFTYGIGLIACILAFYPTNMVIGKKGIRVGLSMSLFGATIGAALCCMINFSFSLFLLGYFIMHFCLTAVHSAKGNFINLFYTEKQVRFICNNSRFLICKRGSVYFAIAIVFPITALASTLLLQWMSGGFSGVAPDPAAFKSSIFYYMVLKAFLAFSCCIMSYIFLDDR